MASPLNIAWDLLKAADFSDKSIGFGPAKSYFDWAQTAREAPAAPLDFADEMEGHGMRNIIQQLSDEDIRRLFYGEDLNSGHAADLPVRHLFQEPIQTGRGSYTPPPTVTAMRADPTQSTPKPRNSWLSGDIDSPSL